MTQQLVLDNLLVNMDIKLVRRLNLKAVLDNAMQLGIATNAADFCKQKNVEPSYISQLINGHRNIGERSARNLEHNLGLNPGALDEEVLSFNSENKQDISKNIEITRRIGYQVNRWVTIRACSKMNNDGLYIINAENTTEGYVPSLTASVSAYAVKASNGVLHPAIRDGWLAVCDPDAPLVPTEYVEVEMKNKYRAIREFLAKTDDIYILQDIKTGDRITLDIMDIEAVTAIIDIIPPSRRMAQIPVLSIKNTD